VKKPLNLDVCNERLARIRLHAKLGKFARAQELERQLWRDILEAAATGHAQAREMASLAMDQAQQGLTVGVSRWCAA
jgi:hypothetical protein